MAAVEEELRGCRSLIIVPDGPMCLIPWAALMDRRGRYLPRLLVQKYLLTSTTVQILARHTLQAKVSPFWSKGMCAPRPPPSSSPAYGGGR